MNQPLDLDAIAGRAAGLYEYATGLDEAWQEEADRLAGTDVPALLDEVRRFRAQQDVLASLAERWQQMADHGDAAIGHFDGPVAATLSAEVGERGRTYRKAADDVCEVLRTGRIPRDLMTDDELDTAAAAVPTVPTTTKDGAQ